MHHDHLGSTHLVSDVTGAYITDCFDYLPGACPERSRRSELNSTDSGISTHKFTGDERDSETYLDHTWVSGFVLANPEQEQFRQYSSQFARWTSPDRMRGHLLNPQTLNRYTDVANNPMNLIDHTGLCGEIAAIVIAHRGHSGSPIHRGRSVGHIRFGGHGAHPLDTIYCPGGGDGGGGGFGGIDGGGGGDPTAGGGIDPNAGNTPLDPNFGSNGPISGFEDPVTGSLVLTNLPGPSLLDLAALNATGIEPPSFADTALQQLAPGVVSGAGVIGDANFVVGFYTVSVLTGAAASAGALIELGAELNVNVGANIATWHAGDPAGFAEGMDIFTNATGAPGTGISVTGAGWGAAIGLGINCLVDPNSNCH